MATALLFDHKIVLFGDQCPQQDIQKACRKILIPIPSKTAMTHCILFVCISTEDPGCSSKKVAPIKHRSRIIKLLCAANALPLRTDGHSGFPPGRATDRFEVPELTCTNVEHSVASRLTKWASPKRMRAKHRLRWSRLKNLRYWKFTFILKKRCAGNKELSRNVKPAALNTFNAGLYRKSTALDL